MAATGSWSVILKPHQVAENWFVLSKTFYRNLWEFESKAGKYATEAFQKSFELKRFNSKGSSPWKSRSKNSRGGHDLMTDTLSLWDSIKWKRVDDGVSVYTDPQGFNYTSRHRGFCYAAVHNGPSQYRRGAVANMPRRQFMGYSSVVKDKLKELSSTIFKGFPQ